MYSIDDGAYQESNVFNNLSDNKEYTVKVKAIDSANRESNVYEMQVRTDEYILPSINVETSSTSDSITINVNGTNGDGEIVKYYYSKDNGSNYEESTSNSYTFNNLTSNTTFYIKVYVEDSNGRVSSEYVTSEETTQTGADYIIDTVYTSDGKNGLYYHDGVGSYTNADQEAGDNSYRYSGANPNNYVCFGSDSAACPNDNLYRIIGLFDDDKDGTYNIKLIKYDYTTSGMLGTNGEYDGTYSESTDNYKGNMNRRTIAAYMWNYDTNVSSYGSNDWTTSELNKINLNTNYINYLSNINIKWANMIATTTWHLGGMDDMDYTAKEFYEGERNNAGYGSNPTTYRDEIGLMYPSDYGYAASPGNWIIDLYDYNGSNNWMYMGLYEWTITPTSSYRYLVFYVYRSGRLDSYYVYSGYAARPVFYLESNVQLEGGSGTSSDPYRLAV